MDGAGETETVAQGDSSISSQPDAVKDLLCAMTPLSSAAPRGVQGRVFLRVLSHVGVRVGWGVGWGVDGGVG